MFKVKDVTNIYSYDEIKKFITTYLKSCKIDFEINEQEYTTETYGIESNHKWCRLSKLPAPFGIGNTEIYIQDNRIRFRYVTLFKRYFDPSDELGYKLYGPEVDLQQDFWYIMIPGLDHDDFSWNYKYGGLEGCQINSHTMKYVIDFLNKLFQTSFVCDEQSKKVAIELINQFDDYSNNYSKTAYSEFFKLVGGLWHDNEWLWETIPFMCHRWDDVNKYDIERALGID